MKLSKIIWIILETWNNEDDDDLAVKNIQKRFIISKSLFTGNGELLHNGIHESYVDYIWI